MKSVSFFSSIDMNMFTEDIALLDFEFGIYFTSEIVLIFLRE